MTGEIIGALAAVLVALVGGVAGWVRIGQHGAETERRKQAERERDDETERAKTLDAPPLDPDEASRLLARLRRRRERVRDPKNRLE